MRFLAPFFLVMAYYPSSASSHYEWSTKMAIKESMRRYAIYKIVNLNLHSDNIVSIVVGCRCIAFYPPSQWRESECLYVRVCATVCAVHHCEWSMQVHAAAQFFHTLIQFSSVELLTANKQPSQTVCRHSWRERDAYYFMNTHFMRTL